MYRTRDDKKSFSRVPLFFCSVPPPLVCLFLGIGCSLTLRATFSHTLDKIGNKEIGLLFPGSSKSPSFKIGDTSRIQVLVVKEEFIIAATEGIIIMTGTNSLMTQIGISSCQDLTLCF